MPYASWAVLPSREWWYVGNVAYSSSPTMSRMGYRAFSTGMHFESDGLSNASGLVLHTFLDKQSAVDVADTDYADKHAPVDDGHAPEVFEAHI